MNLACCCTTCSDCACCCWRRVAPGDGTGNTAPEDGCIFAGETADVCCGEVYDFTLTLNVELRLRPNEGNTERRALLIGSFTVRTTTTDGALPACDQTFDETDNSMTLRTNVQSAPGVFCVPGGFATSIPVPVEYVVEHILNGAGPYPPGCDSHPINYTARLCAATPRGMLGTIDAIIAYTLLEGGYPCGGTLSLDASAGSIDGDQVFYPGLEDGSCAGTAEDLFGGREAWSSTANLVGGTLSYQLHTFHDSGETEKTIIATATWSSETVEPCPCGCALEGEPPEPGACCLPTGDCLATTKAVCATLEGDWAATTCSGGGGLALCPPPSGACCQDDGTCSIETLEDCDTAGGNYLGDGTICADCPPLGACCIPATGACSQATEADCDAADGIWYEGLPCTDPSVLECGDDNGACCLPDGTCTNTTASLCADADGFFFVGQTCDVTTCPLYGACCCPDGVGGTICFETWPAYCAIPEETVIPCLFIPGGTCPDSCGGEPAPLMAPGGGEGGGGAPEMGLTAAPRSSETVARPGASKGKGGARRGCSKCGADKGLF